MNGFLIDANLPLLRSLPTRLRVVGSRELFPGEAEDIVLWSYAREHQLAIVTKDADFASRVLLEGPPPWVVHLKVGNMRKNDLLLFIECHWARIEALVPRHRLIRVSAEEIVALA